MHDENAKINLKEIIVPTIPSKTTLQIIMKKMRDKKTFSFIRFGDQEIKLIEGGPGKPQNHVGSSELTQSIKEAFQEHHEDFMLAAGHIKENIYSGHKKFNFGFELNLIKEMSPIIHKYGKEDFYYSPSVPYLFATESTGMFRNFILEYIRPKKVLFVGGKHLNRPEFINFLGIDLFIQIPSVNAYYSMNEFYPQILKNIAKYDITIICAGIGKVPIQHQLWKDGYGSLDIIGSLSNLIIGDRNARSWMRYTKKEFAELIRDIPQPIDQDNVYQKKQPF